MKEASFAQKIEDNDSGGGGDGSGFGDRLAEQFFLPKHEFFLQWRQGILMISVILVIHFPACLRETTSQYEGNSFMI